MAPSPSPDAAVGEPEAELLLDIAHGTLAAALFGHDAIAAPADPLPPALRTHRGAFVTLHVDGALNGCIGDVEGREPLGRAIARLALAAAFDDPRLPPLNRADWPHLTIEISLLSRLAPVDVSSHAALLAALRPGDGLVVRCGARQGLFLPSVWEQLPHPDDFIRHLWHKAGLTPGRWPADTRVFRFSTQHHHRAVAAHRQDSSVHEPK